MGLNYYEVLGVKKTATTKEVEAGYRRVSKTYHPDNADGIKNPALFTEATQARDTLVDPELRRLYDQFLDGPETREPPRAPRESPRQERSEPWNEYANPRTAEEKARYDAGTRAYWEAQRKPARPSLLIRVIKWMFRFKSPSLLVLTPLAFVWFALFHNLAHATTLLFWVAVLCARFVPKERSTQFWAWTRRKTGSVLSKRVSFAKSARPKVDATK